ncbi:MAG: hypothetical protein R3E32_20315 [Chitinophagales bacterium]
MKNKLLFTAALFVCSFGLYAQDATTPSVWVFEGVINKDIPITMILERSGEEIFGNYYYNKYKKLVGLQGTVRKDGSFELLESINEDMSGEAGYVFDEWKQSGIFSGRYVGSTRLVGTWRNRIKVGNQFKDGSKSYPFSLQRRSKIQYSPIDLKKKLLSFDSNIELQFFLFEHLDFLDWENLYYGDDVMTSASELSREAINVDVYYKNLFGSTTEEAVVQIRFDDWVYYLTTYFLKDKRWQKLPGYVHFAKSATAEEPCAWDKPGNDYFHFFFEEALAPNEFVVVGRTYGGYCAGVTRGNDINFYIWQITPSGIEELYQDTENSYWYESPSPYPSEMPIYNNFVFVEGEVKTFPKRLRKIASVYETGREGSGEGYETYEVVDEKVEYVDLTHIK